MVHLLVFKLYIPDLHRVFSLPFSGDMTFFNSWISSHHYTSSPQRCCHCLADYFNPLVLQISIDFVISIFHKKPISGINVKIKL